VVIIIIIIIIIINKRSEISLKLCALLCLFQRHYQQQTRIAQA